MRKVYRARRALLFQVPECLCQVGHRVNKAEVCLKSFGCLLYEKVEKGCYLACSKDEDKKNLLVHFLLYLILKGL